jgi:CubicO group peptidase (beta-lactamase class C family)
MRPTSDQLSVKIAIIASGLLLVAGMPGWTATNAELGSKADALIQPLVKADRFSGAVLVARDGKPIFRRGYGLANREWDIPNDPTTKFRIGSITKQFTAAAILQLQEAGKLSIDDLVSKYYPDAPAAWNAITIKNLLTHTSGIPDYTAIPHFMEEENKRDRTPEEIVKLTADKPLAFPPGSRFSYDNSGYVLLGYIVEKASGERYADYMQRHIFDPLGMKSTGYDFSETILPKRAAGYRFNHGKIENARFLSMTEPFSAGALYSTVDDMLTWDKALTAGKLLNPASLQAMFTDYGHNYGFGWIINSYSEHQHIAHGGGINGFATQFDRFPKDKLTVVVFSNREEIAPEDQIASGLAAIYLGLPAMAPVAGSEAMLKRTIASLAVGTLNSDDMTPELAEGERSRLPNLHKVMAGLGAMQSVKLQWAGPDGVDHYEVVFQNGIQNWNVWVNKDGKLRGIWYSP